MENEEELYGAGFPLLEKIRLLTEWSPMLLRLQEIGAAKTPHEQAVAIVRLLQWVAGKSMTTTDDEALEHIAAVLRTAEGRAAFAWAHEKLGGGA